jgi:F0F1-type ATP synthase beta subunit
MNRAIRMNASLPYQRSQNARIVESAITVSVGSRTPRRCLNIYGIDLQRNARLMYPIANDNESHRL